LTLPRVAEYAGGRRSPFPGHAWTDRHDARDLTAVTGDRHFLALLDQIEQLPEFIFGLNGLNQTHENLLNRPFLPATAGTGNELRPGRCAKTI
jgi:hypothetical protein